MEMLERKVAAISSWVGQDKDSKMIRSDATRSEGSVRSGQVRSSRDVEE
jgi:hypothetical protein